MTWEEAIICLERRTTIPGDGFSFDDINRAIDMAIRAIEYRIAQSPHPDGDEHIEACSNCGSGEYLTNWDGNRNDYCGQCGQKIDWREEDDDNAAEPDL